MRIGILSYPMLFQREAAVQLQIRETTRALNRVRQHLGFELDVELLGPHPARLDDYDLIHVFSASGGNHRIVEAAAELGIPVVLSPLVSTGWDRACGAHARLSDQRHPHASGPLQSNYAQTRRALQLASAVIALGESERQALLEGFLIDAAKVRVFPNGVSAPLFEATGELFRLRTGMQGPFVLMAGPISPYHDQHGMARALSGLALPFVLLGEGQERDQDYLREVRSVRGVTCLGGLGHDPRMLASAYAAATVLVLPGQGAACTRSLFDALAAGTPVVTGTAARIDLPHSAMALKQVPWDDNDARQRAVLELIASAPAREAVRALVRPFTWERAALQIAGCYIDLLRSRLSSVA